VRPSDSSTQNWRICFEVGKYAELSMSRADQAICAWVRDSGSGDIFSRGWGSSARTDTHLTYMIDIALTTELTLAAGGAQ
jgi:hypothetical protein